ncbi:alpha-tocopherol transfer protein-like isoform X2 [Diorhabda sublineata]|uniref:alpha-tocopherol transfer protein-like isoform X2 n=1 Tax=Diorhabda sublineata TaxID=1163346 RepID=UPI0024E11AA0|nr:alpha-tocopherol transfer protein-like isoform X2 [Diorhabda sublineata]
MVLLKKFCMVQKLKYNHQITIFKKQFTRFFKRLKMSSYLDIDHHSKLVKHFGKSDDHVVDDIKTIKEWLQKEEHLPEMPSDAIIKGFLVINKFNIEKTKDALHIYYTIRELMPDILKGSRPLDEHIQEYTKVLPFLPLPKPTPRMQRVVIVKFRDLENPEDLDLLKNLALYSHINEIKLNEDLSLGDVYILDCLHFKPEYLSKINKDVLKKISFVIEEVWNKTVKEYHLINNSEHSIVFGNLIREHLYEEIKENIYVHDTLEDLYKCIPKEILPKDYGGEEKTYDELLADWNKKVSEFEHRFHKLDNLEGANKLLSRKYKGKNISDYFNEKIKN